MVLGVSGCGLKTLHPDYPRSPRVAVVDTMHGVEIVDHYRWLENDSLPETRRWLREQQRLSRDFLNRLPQRHWLAERLEELTRYDDESMPRACLVGDRVFYHATKKDWECWAFYTKADPKAAPELLLDPNRWGKNTLGATYPSRDGRYCAYAVDEAGKENPVLRVLEVGTKRVLPDSFQGWRQGGVAWLPDNSGFFYTANPLAGTVPAGEEQYWEAVYLHRLGDPPERDRKVFAHDRVKEYFHGVGISEDGRYALFYRSTFYANEVYLSRLDSLETMIPIATGFDARYAVEVIDEKLLIYTDSGAPRGHVFTTALDRLDRASWNEIIPETKDHLEYVAPIHGCLYAVYSSDVHTVIKIFTPEGAYLRNMTLPGLGSAWVSGYWSRGPVWVNYTSFTTPSSIYQYDRAHDSLVLYHRPPVPVDLEGIEARQVWFSSRDGTRIPMFLVLHRDAHQHGDTPVYLTGYGGFMGTMEPYFSASYAVWLEAGGMLAIPALRGGGEYGQEWHRAGMLQNKQNVFDDFLAAARWLIDNRYTDREHLAIGGASNGGLLIGAAVVQAPELFGVAYCGVPLLDMLRYHRFGYANIWAEEYGSAENADEFAFLRAYSPYHNVRDGLDYPATLFIASDNDARCYPLHAMKMTARMQAATRSPRPILFLMQSSSGHGGATTMSESVDQMVDRWAFLMDGVGIHVPPEAE